MAAGWPPAGSPGAGFCGPQLPALSSPGAARSCVDMKVSVGIVLQTADGTVAAQEGQHGTRVASHLEIDGIAGQMARARCSAHTRIAMRAAARGVDGHRAEIGADLGNDTT